MLQEGGRWCNHGKKEAGTAVWLPERHAHGVSSRVAERMIELGGRGQLAAAINWQVQLE
jgi:hypothetical protein